MVQTDLLGRCRRLENLDFAAGVVHAWQVGGFYEVFSAGPIGYATSSGDDGVLPSG